ncbi:50S ribosomal protein L24 [Patescibacteria group bacterium]|nr:50S ribosomal protein L24 [Patescibacteria group bacterium]
MRIRKSDNVVVICGKDKGKKGKVNEVFHEKNRVVVEGAGKMIRHVKPKKEGEKGQRIEFFAPIHASNVALVCGKCNKATRIGMKKIKDGNKQRFCKKCQENLD